MCNSLKEGSSNTLVSACFLGLLAACVLQCYKRYIAGALTSYLHHQCFPLSQYRIQAIIKQVTDRLSHSQYHISQCQSKWQQKVEDDSCYFFRVQMLVKATLQRCMTD